MSNYSYIDVGLIGPEVDEIIRTLLLCGVSLPEYRLHCTLMYDKREIEDPLTEIDYTKEFKANVVSLEILGDGMVFHLVSREMADEHNRLKEAGYQFTFDTFLPHMSITYDFDRYDILLCRRVFANWGGRTLTFSHESYGIK